MKNIFFILSFLFVHIAFSQNFADKEYYLIDSLIIEELSDDDKKLIDTCLSNFHNLQNDTAKINCINTIVNESWDSNVWPKYNQWIFNFSSLRLKEALPETEKKLMLGFYAGSLNNTGLYYSNQGNIKSALKSYHEALEILKDIDEQSVGATCLNNIGILYNSQGDLKNALKYFKESLAIREQLGESKSASAVLNNIGFIYGKLKNYSKSKEYHQKSLNLRLENNDKRGIAESLNNLGTISKREAERLDEIGGSQDTIDLKVEICLDYFKQSILIQKEIKDVNGMSNTYNNIAHVYYDYNDMPQAEKYGEMALALARQNKHARNIKKTSELLARVYENQNKGMLALEMYQLFISTRDTMSNIQTQKATIKQNVQYEFDKKEALAKVEHEKELAITTAEKKQQKMIIWGVSIVLILIVVFSIILINRLRISNAQKLLIEQKNAENELLLGEIHHRVKNNLQVISSLLSLQERSMDDASAKAAILEGKERVKSMGLIHKLLYQNDNYSGVEMDDYVTKLVNGLLDSFGMDEKKINLNIDFSQLKLDVDTAIPMGLIINELVINSLKYAYTNTTEPALQLKLKKEEEQLILEIADNGEGKVSDLEGTNSFGMKLVKSLSRQLGGKLIFNDDAGLNIQINISDFKLV